MKRTECIAVMKARMPVIHCVTATHDAIEYECITAIVLMPDGKGGLDMSVDLQSKSGNSITRAKPENIRIKGELEK